MIIYNGFITGLVVGVLVGAMAMVLFALKASSDADDSVNHD